MEDNARNGGVAELDPHGLEQENEYRVQNEDEDDQPGIGARIVAIPALANRAVVIPQPAQRQQPDVPPPDPQRLVDVQRQQQMLADLTRPMGRPPVLQPQALSNGSGAAAPATAPRTAQPPAPVSARPVRPSAPARPAARASSTPQSAARPQGAGGNTAQTASPGIIDRAAGYLHDAEKGIEDKAASIWHWMRGDKQGSAPASNQGSAPAANQRRVSPAPQGSAKQTGGHPSNQGNAGAQQGGPVNKGGGQAKNEDLPKKLDGNFGPRVHKDGTRKGVPTRKSSDNGNNIYVAPKGEKLMDVIYRGYIKNGKGNAECVQLVQSLVGAPNTGQWKPGTKVEKGVYIPPGTAIATFVDGQYPQGEVDDGERHAAIYLGQTEEGIWVIDQSRDSRRGKDRKSGPAVPVIQVRLIPWTRTKDTGKSNNGSAFSVITWGPQAKAGTASQ